ncbi:hypothetical protein RhiirA5_426745 [Rhizophagus irregularis]|uniref:Uncharacterized protein n=2 Tax=Rhizophagus irregularis TaxID=588596 RepID=A0A2N0P3K4_9GLOM|nr:hypothetical protein RhiirA5_426745 [Rhizophagus irregularis]PKC64576.1 hypothetical protein RhiirA1_462223 [Rhizophagus irregularis]
MTLPLNKKDANLDPKIRPSHILISLSPPTICSSWSFHPFTANFMVPRRTHGPQTSLWLVLYTSNFLHSGGWSSHIQHPSDLELDLVNSFSICKFNFFSVSFSLIPMGMT